MAVNPSANRRGRVLVIGAGIAGCSCAWALERGGYEVTLLERNAVIGGNARTHDWAAPGGGSVTSGLSVSAWPRPYFRNYGALLRAFGIPTADVEIRFSVARAGTGGREYLEHGDAASPLAREFATDFARWRRLVAFVRAVNGRFAGDAELSLYHVQLLNPLSAVPLWLLARACGILRAFWNDVFVPIHSSSFLAANMDAVPACESGEGLLCGASRVLSALPSPPPSFAVVAPMLEDMIALERGGTMTTWATGSSKEVFAALVAPIAAAGRLHTGTAAARVWASGAGTYAVECGGSSSDGGASGPAQQQGVVLDGFHHVVFAGNARAAAAVLRGVLPWPARALLSAVTYAEDDPGRGAMFTRGVVHSDGGVIPAPRREAALRRCSNYVEVGRGGGGGGSGGARYRYDNTFILSSWAPCLAPWRETAGPAATAAAPPPPCLVSYALPPGRQPAAALASVDNRAALPELTLRNLLVALLLPMVQGGGGVHFAGNWATPGNGHDLSLVSGLLAARRIGAPYPFAADAGAAADFERAAALLDRCTLVPRGAAVAWFALCLAVLLAVVAAVFGGWPVGL